LVQIDFDANGMKFIHGLDEVLQGSAQAINGPHSYQIEFALGRLLEHSVQRRTIIAPLRAADSVIAERLYDSPAAKVCDAG
jgi:hypothetical protein